MVIPKKWLKWSILLMKLTLTLSLPESVMETLKVVLTFASVDEILWCDHSNETSTAELSNGSIYILVLYKMKFGIPLKF